MLSVLSNRTFRHLFLAQVVALFGTGLATVALGLLAFELAGENAALVMGAALTVKMVAFVLVGPLAGAFAAVWPRRQMLIVLDIIRAAVAMMLPFVTDVWQIFALIFVLQCASAAFTPTFQATIPEVIPDENDYTRALSLSRLAYDLESLLSPVFAGVLLIVFAYDALFIGTTVGFLASALLIAAIALPRPAPGARRPVWDRTTRGIRIYLATPRLRGLLALSFAAAAASALVIVGTILIVRGTLGLSDVALAWTLAAFGAGSMVAALSLPKLLEARPDRPVMLTGAALMALVLLLLGLYTAVAALPWGLLLLAWFLLGLGYSATLTPAGRLLRRSVHTEDLPAIFAAQFALSHACWLITYPLAGLSMTWVGPPVTFLLFGGLAALGLVLALQIWPAEEPRDLPQSHPDLPEDHPHLRGAGRHAHPYVIDALHPTRPERPGP
ncbi:MAG: MFS transporter [Pseudomonadota bacterium]